jgi:cold shock CspA family protein
MAWRGDRTYPRGRASASNFNACHWRCLPMWDYLGRHDDELPVRYVSLEEIRARRAGDAAPSPSPPPRGAGFRVHLGCGGAIIADATGGRSAAAASGSSSACDRQRPRRRSSHPSYFTYRGGSMPPRSSLSLATKPGWISKFAGTLCRAECLDQMPRLLTAIAATRMEMKAQIIARRGAPFQMGEGQTVALPSQRRVRASRKPGVQVTHRSTAGREGPRGSLRSTAQASPVKSGAAPGSERCPDQAVPPPSARTLARCGGASLSRQGRRVGRAVTGGAAAMTGRVVTWYRGRGYGWLCGRDRREYFCHASELRGVTALAAGELVEFRPRRKGRRAEAVRVRRSDAADDNGKPATHGRFEARA